MRISAIRQSEGFGEIYTLLSYDLEKIIFLFRIKWTSSNQSGVCSKIGTLSFRLTRDPPGKHPNNPIFPRSILNPAHLRVLRGARGQMRHSREPHQLLLPSGTDYLARLFVGIVCICLAPDCQWAWRTCSCLLLSGGTVSPLEVVTARSSTCRGINGGIVATRYTFKVLFF